MDDSLKMNATIVKEEIENIDADLDDPLKMYATTVKEEITVKEEVFEENEIYVDSGISNAPAGKVEVKQEKKSGEETEIATEEMDMSVFYRRNREDDISEEDANTSSDEEVFQLDDITQEQESNQSDEGSVLEENSEIPTSSYVQLASQTASDAPSTGDWVPETSKPHLFSFTGTEDMSVAFPVATDDNQLAARPRPPLPTHRVCKHRTGMCCFPTVMARAPGAAGWSKEQDKLLIETVANYPWLFLQSDESYKDVDKRRNSWQKISQVLGIAEEDCKQRWRHLRDRYTKLRRKKNTPVPGGSGVDAAPVVKWALYKLLDAILHTTVKHRSGGNSFTVTHSPSSGSSTPSPKQDIMYQPVHGASPLLERSQVEIMLAEDENSFPVLASTSAVQNGGTAMKTFTPLKNNEDAAVNRCKPGLSSAAKKSKLSGPEPWQIGFIELLKGAQKDSKNNLLTAKNKFAGFASFIAQGLEELEDPVLQKETTFKIHSILYEAAKRKYGK